MSAQSLYIYDAEQDNGPLKSLDIHTDRCERLGTIDNYPSVGSTSSTSILAVGTFSGKLHLIDLRGRKTLTNLDLGSLNTVGAATWSGDGRILAAGLIGKVKGDHLFVFRAPFREKPLSLRVSEYGCEQVALSYKGELVAGLGSDDVIRVWRLPN